MVITAKEMRKLMDMFEQSDSEFMQFCQMGALKTTNLFECNNPILVENALMDKIQLATSKVIDRFKTIDLDTFLRYARLTMDKLKNQSNETSNSQKVLQHIIDMTTKGAKNTAMLTVLLGMVATIAATVSNPAQAETFSYGLEDIIRNSKIDDMISRLKAAGVEIDTTAPADDVLTNSLAGVPEDIAIIAQKATRALLALDRFTFAHGEHVEAKNSLLSTVTLDANVNTNSDHVQAYILISLPGDTPIVLNELKVVYAVRDGNIEVKRVESGIRNDLTNIIEALPSKQSQAVQAYISFHSKHKPEATDTMTSILDDFFNKKGVDITMMVGSMVADRGPGKYRVQADSKGTKVKVRS